VWCECGSIQRGNSDKLIKREGGKFKEYPQAGFTVGYFSSVLYTCDGDPLTWKRAWGAVGCLYVSIR
jgi:hypothetical protein